MKPRNAIPFKGEKNRTLRSGRATVDIERSLLSREAV